MVWVGEDLKYYLVPTALPQDGQGHLPLDQLTLTPFQGGFTISLGNLFQCLSPPTAVFQVSGKVKQPHACIN